MIISVQSPGLLKKTIKILRTTPYTAKIISSICSLIRCSTYESFDFYFAILQYVNHRPNQKQMSLADWFGLFSLVAVREKFHRMGQGTSQADQLCIADCQ